MVYRAFNVLGEAVEFTLEDSPLRVGENLIALTAHKGSRLLDINTISRKSERGIYEGDFVKYGKSNEIGVVYYKNGFMVQTKEGEPKKLNTIRHITLIRGNELTSRYVSTIIGRTPLLFKDTESGITFTIDNILFKSKERLYIDKNKLFVSLENIREIAAIVKDTAYYVGDAYNEGIICIDGDMPTCKQ